MSTMLLLVALALVGFAGGRWLRGQPVARRRRVAWPLAGLPLAGLGLIMLGGLLGSDKLGWLGGLALMFMLPAALPLLAGAALGWLSAGRGDRARHAAADQAGDATRAAAPAPRQPAPQAALPAAPSATSRLPLLLVVLAVGCGFWVLIGLGFRFHGQKAPAPIDAGLWPALGLLLLLLALALRAALRHWRRRRRLAQQAALRSEPPLQGERRRQWLAELAADPRTRVYAERIAAGDVFWTPERVAYDLDPQATACCTHLAPLERALRDAGWPLCLAGPAHVDAAVRTDEAAVRARWALPACVRYEEFVAWDRAVEDLPVARWHCTQCESLLSVRHPQAGDASFSRS